MNVLVIGSGGREHALAWKIAQSPDAGDVFVASDGNITVIGANTSDDEDTSFFTDAANAVLSILPDSLQPETDEGRAFYDYQERANGILAQSIGGGGGVGGMNVTGVITPDGSPLGVGVGGTGGAGGEAGDGWAGDGAQR